MSLVLITAPFDDGVAAGLRHSWEVVHRPADLAPVSLAERARDDADFAAALGRARALVCEVDRVDAATLELAGALELVVSCRANPVNVDLEACAARGVTVATTPGRNADVTADLAFALLLATLRRTGTAERWMRAGHWQEGDVLEPYRTFRGPALRHRALGVLGGGAVGRRVAARALGFGMPVLVHDPFLAAGALGPDVEIVGFDELLRRADVLTVHVPLTETTMGLVGRAELATMRPGSYLVNAGRAAIVDETALVEAARSGHLAGVGLDVFWSEPPAADHPLLALDTVTVTPHIGGASDDVVVEHSRMAAEALEALSSGRTVPHVADGTLVAATRA